MFTKENGLYVAHGPNGPISICGKMANRHGLIAGATGTGKTFTIANVIKEVNKPTLVLAHNKTLAGQLYSELKENFPENRVEYFVSYYDSTKKISVI